MKIYYSEFASCWAEMKILSKISAETMFVDKPIIGGMRKAIEMHHPKVDRWILYDEVGIEMNVSIEGLAILAFAVALGVVVASRSVVANLVSGTFLMVEACRGSDKGWRCHWFRRGYSDTIDDHKNLRRTVYQNTKRKDVHFGHSQSGIRMTPKRRL